MNEQAPIESDILASAISADAPIGVDVREDGPAQALYYKLRDLRSNVRAEERRMENLENIEQRIALCPEWVEVRDVAHQLLAEYTKDVEILAWYIEAETRLSGFEGLAKGFSILQQILESFGTELFPPPEETDADRFDALTGLNGGGREGALIQPIRLLPLVPDAPYGEFAFWYRQNGQEPELLTEMGKAGNTAMLSQLGHIQSAIASIKVSDAILTGKYGADAPPFSLIYETLGDVEMWLKSHVTAPLETTENDDEIQDSDVAQDTKPVGAITTRDEAFAKLLDVAAFFRKTEPHSPISHALETIVHRGRMDFMTLLEELIPDESMRRNVMTTAGIREKNEPQ
ncbi:ImpA family type VI secretion system protein [Parasulfitobacter algicola]|uniref:Type VI secretion system ImpA family N-terminal domain-containing protein n=1 Tax=Parasulfitobacter algicola TaxID=2614809 RepID=A0ABX2IUL0_9RHOB|nr:type VI secretion system ImpA family N-terminal domain-containing protein [Sulfitobacter algicola]NSX53738.1 type VI secretion system ImpA family N-terminal domain-containing protein [Sulfitobacter algicola]